jgi:putative nucleotidyltransferase with HDIG domain
MKRTATRRIRVHRGLMVLLAIVAVTGVINFFVVNQRAFLNFYYLPVVFGAYTLGLRRGFYSAVLAVAIVYSIALMNEHQFATTVGETWMRWLDLGTWGGFLLLTSYLVGSLYEEKQRQVAEIQAAYQGILEIMTKFIDSVDHYTQNHSRRVADYAVEVARALGLGETEVEDIRVGAWLHDIGKVDISMDVLRKAAGLTPEELEEMRRHVETGEKMVRSMGGILKHVIPMVAYHHERWDGTGYHGLTGPEIPVGARVIAVADTFDAIVSDRPYRRAKSHVEAINVIRQETGRQFDPEVVEEFLKLYAVAPPDVGPEDEDRDADGEERVA